MSEIRGVELGCILDSRGNPTVEATVSTNNGNGRGAAPSGASTGSHEAVSLPAKTAVKKEQEVESKLKGLDASTQKNVDEALRELDGTSNFSDIGANVAVSVSIASARAAADEKDIALHEFIGDGRTAPVPLGNIIGGGEHAEGGPNIQEYLSIPVHLDDMQDRVFFNADIHGAARDELRDRSAAAGKGDEGAWAPDIGDDEAMEVMREAVTHVGGGGCRLGLDVAASEMYSSDSDVYRYRGGDRSREEQIEFIESLIRDNDLLYVEDPLQEEDFQGFAELTERVSDTDALICGDDLFVTNVERINRGIEEGACNAVLIKPNQIGTLTDTYRAIETARDADMTPVISHRSGETEDTAISHIATGLRLPYIKTGAVGGERIAKLNELIRIHRNT